MTAALTTVRLLLGADFQVCQPGHDVVFSLHVLDVDAFVAFLRHAILDEPDSGEKPTDGANISA